jgi:hypothetical protein
MFEQAVLLKIVKNFLHLMFTWCRGDTPFFFVANYGA